jgi:excisionase family DNA binding protein
MNQLIPKRWLDVQQCAEYLSLTVSAVYNLVHRRKIPFSRLNTRLRFDRIELDRWLKQGS